MSLSELVIDLVSSHASGTLSIEQDAVKRSVVLKDGYVVNASSNVPSEYLGQFLINLGHITEEQFQQCYTLQKESNIFLGRLLVQAKLVSENTLHHVLAMKYRETLLEAYQWNGGEFVFSQHCPVRPVGFEVKVLLAEIHEASAARVAAWKAIRQIFRHRYLTLKVNEEAIVDPIRAGSLDSKMLEMARLGSSIEEIALATHSTSFFLYSRLYAYYRMGVIEVGKANSGPHVSATQSDTDLALAQMAIVQGEYREAWTLIRRSREQEKNATSTRLLSDLQALWHPTLKAQWVNDSKVPKRKIPGLTGFGLTSAERYLLSRIDGEREAGALCSVAPLPEFEVLASFDYFLGMGYIALKEPELFY